MADELRTAEIRIAATLRLDHFPESKDVFDAPCLSAEVATLLVRKAKGKVEPDQEPLSAGEPLHQPLCNFLARPMNFWRHDQSRRSSSAAADCNGDTGVATHCPRPVNADKRIKLRYWHALKLSCANSNFPHRPPRWDRLPVLFPVFHMPTTQNLEKGCSQT